MAGEAIQESPCELFAPEHLRPFREIQIRGHDDGLTLVAVGHHLEKEFRTSFRERDVPDLVDDHQVELGEYPLDL